MDIGLRHVGKIEIHHVADAIDVNAAGGNVGGDQGADLAGAECRQHPLAVVLRLVAVNGIRGDAGPCEALHHLVRAMLGPGKDQRAVDRLLLQKLRQQGGLGRVVDLDDALGNALDGRGDRRHRHTGWIAQHLFGEFGDILWHRRRKEQRLPLDRHFGDDFSDVVDEAHVQHAVGLVEHEKLDLSELQAVALHEIEQAAGRRYHDFDPWHDRPDLASHRDAADRQCRTEADVTAIGVKTLENLSRQFACRAEHKHAAGFGLRLEAMLQNAMQDGKREGCGLAGAGLGDADDVAAGKCKGNGLSLDGCGREIILFFERTRDGIGEAEILKGGQKAGSFHYKRQAPGGVRQERARGARDTRVFGASVLVS